MRTFNMTAMIWKERAPTSRNVRRPVRKLRRDTEEALRISRRPSTVPGKRETPGMLRDIHDTLAAPGKFTTSFAASVR